MLRLIISFDFGPGKLTDHPNLMKVFNKSHYEPFGTSSWLFESQYQDHADSMRGTFLKHVNKEFEKVTGHKVTATLEVYDLSEPSGEISDDNTEPSNQGAGCLR